LDKRIKDLKNKYEQIDIPENVDEVIDKGIMKGRMEMKRERQKRNWVKGLGAVAAAALLLTVTVNMSPAVANSIENIPGVGKLVQVLKFDQGTSSGGTVTDGSDVSFIVWQRDQQDKDIEKLIINFGSGDNAVQDIAPNYDINYSQYPCSMTFTVSGARKLSAEKDLAALKESKFITDAYKLLTMDDSMVRFTVNFNGPVEYEVKEYQEPAQLVVTLQKDRDASLDQAVYSVRTASYPWGEGFGMLEEQLMGIESRRVLKDKKGTFLVETGYFTTEQEAKIQQEELTKTYGENLQLYVEKRGLNDKPEAIVDNN
jgi:hypothetical protein